MYLQWYLCLLYTSDHAGEPPPGGRGTAGVTDPCIGYFPSGENAGKQSENGDGHPAGKAHFTFSKGCHIDKNVDAYFTDGYNNLTDELEFEIKEMCIRDRCHLRHPLILFTMAK